MVAKSGTSVNSASMPVAEDDNIIIKVRNLGR